MSITRVAVLPDPAGGRPRLDLGGADGTLGRLRARLLAVGARSARVALVADGALLLAGDRVRVEVLVGPGTAVEVVEPAGTVAYDMRGGSAVWEVEARVGAGGTLVWQGLPFVVSEGADVRRTTSVRLEEGGSLALRETLVLGRAGEGPGRLTNRTRVRDAHGPVLVEDLEVAPGLPRTAVVGSARVLDSVLVLGRPGPVAPPSSANVERFELAGGRGTLWRGMAESWHTLELAAAWRQATAG